MERKILVTGIGGVVGQGILRNIRDSYPEIPLIGTNVIKISPGNYLCDKTYCTAYGYENIYIEQIQKICTKENIGLIIPSTDYESYYLGLNQKSFNCHIATSPPEVTELCLDKFKTYIAFKNVGIPFAESQLPSSYNNEFENYIIKPREGRGSRGIFINPENPQKFADTYLIQELLDGEELTTGFYVNKLGHLHGLITFRRELEQGNTSKAEVTFNYDDELKTIILKMIENFPFHGSNNIQTRATKKGIIPFEINGRISGTNSIRAQFGFKDVLYTVQEYFLNVQPDTPTIKYGSALRLMLDIIYPERSLDAINNKNDQYFIH